MADQRKATVFRLKDDCDFEEAIEGFPGHFREVPELDGLRAFVKFDEIRSRKTTHQIPWLAFINSGLGEDPLTFESYNRFPRALILLERETDEAIRRYAMVFGMHADQPLDKERIVHDFGLRVGMNLCDSEIGIKRLQTAAHEAISVQTERQASSGTSLGGFAVDLDAENIKTLTGIARGEFRDRIENIRGKDQVTFRLPQDNRLEWDTLADYLDILETRSRSTDYENTEFRDFDRFRLENDPEVVELLDEIVAGMIELRQFETIHLAPPDFIDVDDVTFAYRPRSEDGTLPRLYDDLRITELIDQPRRRLADLTVSRLKGWKIYRYDGERDYLGTFANAYRCLVAEVQHDGNTYILSGGKWREVSQDLLSEVDDYLDENISIVEREFLPDGINIYDASTGTNRESVFCRHVSEEFDEVYCFDQANILIGNRQQYEVCDLLTLNGDMVQAKRYSSGAASISHLFLQAKFYAHAFTADRSTCADMRRWLTADQRDWNAGKDKAAFLAIIPENREDVVERNFTVLFCILYSGNELGLGDLPFMSRYELMKSHRFLTRDRKFAAEISFVRVETGQP